MTFNRFSGLSGTGVTSNTILGNVTHNNSLSGTWTLAEGADGVLICGCHPGDCHYVEGNYKAMRRYSALKRVLQSYGIADDRVRLEWVSASEGIRFAQIVNDVTEKIRKLGPSKVKLQLAADAAER